MRKFRHFGATFSDVAAVAVADAVAVAVAAVAVAVGAHVLR